MWSIALQTCLAHNAYVGQVRRSFLLCCLLLWLNNLFENFFITFLTFDLLFLFLLLLRFFLFLWLWSRLSLFWLSYVQTCLFLFRLFRLSYVQTCLFLFNNWHRSLLLLLSSFFWFSLWFFLFLLLKILFNIKLFHNFLNLTNLWFLSTRLILFLVSDLLLQ